MPVDEERRRRIVVTHTGSLPRPPALSALLFSDQPHEAEARAAVTDIVARQHELGIDVISDGEQSRVSFQVYALSRLSGLRPIEPAPGVRRTRENIAFPAFYRGGVHPGSARARFACTGKIEYRGEALLAADIETLKAALNGRDAIDVFMPAVSPSSLASQIENHQYASEEEFVVDCAEAMRVEYEAIVAAGFLLQIDDPRLAMHSMLTPELTVGQTRAWTRRRIEILNHALRNIPPRASAPPHMLRYQHGSAGQRFRTETPRRSVGGHSRWLSFTRDGESAPRA
jgi:5-methyltetrahydropteroyltriglutamate--homocysteine methyltransferase